jgi:hypothetical protein
MTDTVIYSVWILIGLQVYMWWKLRKLTETTTHQHISLYLLILSLAQIVEEKTKASQDQKKQESKSI